MVKLKTKLVKDGNSMAVRLSKQVLEMSGLHGDVVLEIKQGQIIVRAAPKISAMKSRQPREGWEEQIKRELKAHGPISYTDEYGDMMSELDATVGDGLDDE